MATLTIRNLEDTLKSRLRLRAAARNRSMEDEVRHILRAVLQEPAVPASDLGEAVQVRVRALMLIADVSRPRTHAAPTRSNRPHGPPRRGAYR